MQEEIKKIYDVLEDRGRILESNQRNIEMLFLHIQGSDDFGSIGYKDRISTNEEDIESLEKEIDRQEQRFNNIYSKVVGICIGVSLAASSLGFLIKNSIVKTKANPIARVERIDDSPINDPAYPEIQYRIDTMAIREDTTEIKPDSQ